VLFCRFAELAWVLLVVLTPDAGGGAGRKRPSGDDRALSFLDVVSIGEAAMPKKIRKMKKEGEKRRKKENPRRKARARAKGSAEEEA
jgi:hypothetical protein